MTKTKKKDTKSLQKKRKRMAVHEKIGVNQTTVHIVYALFLGFFGTLFLASAFSKAGIVGNKIYTKLDI
jgi:hypothetical protein